MRNFFNVIGYAVNQRGLTVGINYQVIASDVKHATLHALARAQQQGYSNIKVSYVRQGVEA